ncbi:post-GPI attachment to proteins factor 2-like isoform X2 [Actinia tenebrosa]|uniref:Post-GPI attachment to proteins factor 2-like isoform X2 n=1 Tax=Actinia tenebrosa TaxID=6105 RepID=A0A6P8H3W6_ACTTE|nr:post-GPI attachment to proteins factor 2-like isoform X2 [Actinia tenebrosa]
MISTSMRNPLLEVDCVLLTGIICLLPLVSSVSCVLLSILLHFDEVTKSHCRVPNYLPSISAATGDYSPEKYIWRIGIAYHSFMRLIVVILEHRILHNRIIGTPSTWFVWMTRIKSLLLVVENFALLMLTYVSSDDNYSVHEKSFILFMVAGMIHMLLSCFLRYKSSKSPKSHEETKSFRRKVTLVGVNYGSFALAVYFFFRHNWYCESGVYSLFAFCEYIVVISNILFHCTIVDDLKGFKLLIGHPVPPTATKYN